MSGFILNFATDRNIFGHYKTHGHGTLVCEHRVTGLAMGLGKSLSNVSSGPTANRHCYVLTARSFTNKNFIRFQPLMRN